MAFLHLLKIISNKPNNYFNMCKRVLVSNLKIKNFSNIGLDFNRRPTIFPNTWSNFTCFQFSFSITLLSWLGFTEEDKDKDSELITILKRSVLCTQLKEYDKAEQMLHLALRLAQQQQNQQGILYCYDLMANLAFDTFQLDKAEKLFVSVLQMLLSSGTTENDLKVIHISLKMARIAQLKADLNKAEMGYNWCIKNIENQKQKNYDSKHLEGIIHDWYAQFLLDKNDIENATIHLQQAYQICNELGENHSEKTMLLLNDLAIANFRAGNLDNAQKLLNKAIQIGQHVEDSSHVGVVHANLGLILLEKGIEEEAEKWCLGAYKLGKKYENNEAIEQANYCLDQIKLHREK